MSKCETCPQEAGPNVQCDDCRDIDDFFESYDGGCITCPRCEFATMFAVDDVDNDDGGCQTMHQCRGCGYRERM